MPRTQALKARVIRRLILNPRQIARRNRRRAFAATRGIPLGMSACDGALVVYLRIPTPSRAGLGLPKRRHIRAARKSRGTEQQALRPMLRTLALSLRRV